jgi:hypothetical protein
MPGPSHGTFGAADHTDPFPPVPAEGAGWYETLSFFRRLGGLPVPTVNATYSAEAVEHARYTVEVGVLDHNQDIPSPAASAGGLRAARQGNGYASGGVVTDERVPIEGWADSIGHGAWMFNPRLTETGFGMVSDPSRTGLRTSAWLNVLGSNSGTRGTETFRVPASGTVVSLDERWAPTATENFRAQCPSAPADAAVLLVYFPTAPTATPTAQVTRDGAAVGACAFSAQTYDAVPEWNATFRSILGSVNLVVVVLDERYQPDSSYRATVEAGTGLRTTWGFSSASEEPPPPGYWMLSSDGTVHGGFCGTVVYGSATVPRGTTATDIEPTRDRAGYWVLRSDGHLAAFGSATPFPAVTLQAGERATSLTATRDGTGLWVFTDRGRALTRGSAVFYGDRSGQPLNGPVLGSVATPSGRGYYMVASDGGVFAYGDARFMGSMGGQRLNAPVRSLVPDPDGSGYWLVASDGGVFAYDAPFVGSMPGELAPGVRLNQPVTGMVSVPGGYLMVAADGGIFDFSRRGFCGSLAGNPPRSPVVAVAAYA